MAGYSSFKNSYIIVRGKIIPIRFKPDRISESKSSDYSPTEIYGRSSPLLGYSGSDSRRVSLSIIFCVDGINYKSFDEVDEYIRLLKSSLYPEYGNPRIIPPQPVIVNIEKVLKIIGVVTSVECSVREDSAWNVKEQKPYIREVALDIIEIRRVPLSWDEVTYTGGEPDA